MSRPGRDPAAAARCSPRSPSRCEQTFDCPEVDSRATAILSLRTLGVTPERGELRVNGAPLVGVVAHPSSARGGWASGTLLVSAGTLRAEGNVVGLVAGPDDPEWPGDGEAIDRVVVFYRVRCPPVAADR